MYSIINWLYHVVDSNLTLNRRLLTLFIELMSFSKNLLDILLDLFFEQSLKFSVEPVVLAELDRQIMSIIAFSNQNSFILSIPDFNRKCE